MDDAELRITADPQETAQLAADLARALTPGDVVLISGDLGAGKTTFVRGACRALGITGRVTSPTFTIVRRYEDGRVPVSHLDLYRLADGVDDAALLEDELSADRVAFIEWPSAGLGGLAEERIAARVHLEHLPGERRSVRIERRAA
ncbi:unannotated protein [freshwater metagenome]|uniref:tRNA threonylcarbamoyladenosine biosynthesis protein TsaE n=1 Tax=freshwater metagenome TaxID=449393 RepID=A0A6J7IH86_9ZZZZ|nr:tRNA (adenosine(37)-N6)-threonylcarbamoyltransferase complex ATPase subunit type 1 TsaE [Actinomycetota bacterium]